MILTIVGDPHAKPDNLDKINTLFDLVENLGNNTIWLGDLLDTKEVVRGKALNTYLRRFTESNLKHYVLVGNHDWFNLECKEHSLEALKALPNVIMVDKPLVQGDLVFFPYTHASTQFRSWLKEHCGGSSQLFCHVDVRGFDYGNGLISEEGMEVSDFDKIKRVISGHYHKYQERGNITYLGTPFSHSFGESNQTKYLGLYDPASDKLELIETPFSRHTTLEIDCAEHTSVETNGIDLYRVILTGTQEEIDKFQKIEGIKYIERPLNVVNETLVSETDSPEIQFQKWATEIKGYSKDILDLGLGMLADA